MGFANAASGVCASILAFQKLTGKGVFIYNLDGNDHSLCFLVKNLSVHFISMLSIPGSGDGWEGCEICLTIKIVKQANQHKSIYYSLDKTFNNKGSQGKKNNTEGKCPGIEFGHHSF